MANQRPTVLILGAGINGCALARELAINGLSVVVVERRDIAAGTTAYSSRLIHGGLRYLEYGEFSLVRESLAERARLLRLSPHLVRPLELFIPVPNRFSGIWQSARRFFGLSGKGQSHSRGLLLVRLGLMLYDAYARDPTLPKHRIHPLGEGPPVDRQHYHWLASYFDAQIRFPERLSVALLADALAAAQAIENQCEVFTYHEARLQGRHVTLLPAEQAPQGDMPTSLESVLIEPAAIINATGAWVDDTLARLHIPCERLMGGTKGTHFLTAHSQLAEALAGRAIYAEAPDGRPVFILPFGEMTLVGTTDESYQGDPYQAVASQAELDYLLAAVREVFPQFELSPADIAFSYSGVRPLPHSDASSTAAISREHFLKRHPDAPLPLYSIVGGKLTTCRSLAEEVAQTVLADLGLPVVANSRDRIIPGGQSYPPNAAAVATAQADLARVLGLSEASVAATWRLHGTRSREVLSGIENGPTLIRHTELPLSVARWAIRHEWVTRLPDLVERRLMLLYDQGLSHAALVQLAELLAAEGCLPADQIETEVATTVERLRTHFGKHLDMNH